MTYSKHLTRFLGRRDAIALKVATEMFLEKNADRLDNGERVEIKPLDMAPVRVANALLADKDNDWKIEEINGVYYVTWLQASAVEA